MISYQELKEMGEAARQERDYLLGKRPKLKEFQKEIDRRLNNAGNFEKRMAILEIMIEAKLIEFREQFSKLLLVLRIMNVLAR